MGTTAARRFARALSLGTALAAPSAAVALNVTPTSDPLALAGTLLLANGGLTWSDAALSGSFGQAGTYLNAQGTYGLPHAGIVLSSGHVGDYATGPDGSLGFSTNYDVPATPEEEALLGPITGLDLHFDVVRLDFSFLAPVSASSVTFFGAFGSEEWPDFVGSGFTDGFGLYLNGQNVAQAPTGFGGGALPINIDHPDMQAIGGTELAGILAPNGSPVLRFDVPVVSGSQNDFTIILADAGDSFVDTTIYLSSFFARSQGPGTGMSEFDPVGPAGPADPGTGALAVALPEVPAGTTLWIDPPLAVGYEYAIANNQVTALRLPSLASVLDLDGYTIGVDGAEYAVIPGQSIDLLELLGYAPTAFTLTGVDPELGLDAAGDMTFPLGLSFLMSNAETVVTVTPLTVDGPPNVIPLPGGLALYGGGLVLAGAVLRRRRRP